MEKENFDKYLGKEKKPKYVKINGVRVITPKDIVYLPWYKGKCEIYGDPRVPKQLFDDKQLEGLNKLRMFLVVLKKKKREGGAHAFPISLSYLMNQRKARLSNFINMEKIAEAERKQQYKTAVDYIKELLPISEEMTKEQIFEEFQTSMDPSLICTDIKRIIQLYHEDKIEAQILKKTKIEK